MYSRIFLNFYLYKIHSDKMIRTTFSNCSFYYKYFLWDAIESHTSLVPSAISHNFPMAFCIVVPGYVQDMARISCTRSSWNLYRLKGMEYGRSEDPGWWSEKDSRFREQLPLWGPWAKYTRWKRESFIVHALPCILGCFNNSIEKFPWEEKLRYRKWFNIFAIYICWKWV